jgi:hypothetical protein
LKRKRRFGSGRGDLPSPEHWPSALRLHIEEEEEIWKWKRRFTFSRTLVFCVAFAY